MSHIIRVTQQVNFLCTTVLLCLEERPSMKICSKALTWRAHYWACYWGSAKVRLPSLAASKACSFKSKLILVIAILWRVFLWWRSNDLSKPAAGFQMLVHLFGATSSPACASYALKSRWRQRDCCQCRCRFYRQEFFLRWWLRQIRRQWGHRYQTCNWGKTTFRFWRFQTNQILQ